MNSHQTNYKNIAQGSFAEVLIDDDFYVLKIQNEGPEVQKVTRDIDSSFIQFHFCLKGNAKFIFNDGHYALEVSEENSLLLYNTQIDLPLNLELNPMFMDGICNNDHTKVSFSFFKRSGLYSLFEQ